MTNVLRGARTMRAPTPPTTGAIETQQHNTTQKGSSQGGYPEDNQPVRWQHKALCRGLTELFFPERGDVSIPAKRLCQQCPVQTECLEAGVGEFYGIWGGISVRERQRIRIRRAADNGLPRPPTAKVRHGNSTGYNTDGCRCDLCRKWMADTRRRYYHRRNVAAAS